MTMVLLSIAHNVLNFDSILIMISKFINIIYFIPANKIVCVFSNGSQESRFYWKHFGHVVLLPTVLSANREPAPPPQQFSLASPLDTISDKHWHTHSGIEEKE